MTLELEVEGLPVSLPLISALAYLAVVLALKRTVTEPWRISPFVVAAHNAFIAAWSLLMFLGAMYHIIRNTLQGWSGVEFMYCDPLDGKEASLTGEYWWLWMYHVSKYYELFDTLIICLKMRPLIFLHYYHHAIIVPVTWAWMTFRLRFTIIGMAFNTLVHVFMYTFYATSGLAKWAEQNPKSALTPIIHHVNTVWKRNITRFQIFQFMSSFLLSIPFVYYAIEMTPQGRSINCHGVGTFIMSAAMNASFLFMFVGFFKRTYKKADSKAE